MMIKVHIKAAGSVGKNEAAFALLELLTAIDAEIVARRG